MEEKLLVYVKDVAKSVVFYAKAFGHKVRRLDESHRWGELESGETTIAFTPIQQHETDDLTGEVLTPHSGRERQPVEICFDYVDIDAAYKRAVENGAVLVSEAEEKVFVGETRNIYNSQEFIQFPSLTILRKLSNV
ncbi:hypothetical protein M9H77_15908 [Catharanthus roseus]|uniref:Uncharacterized protein n=1 Tax=Catharanthus roseus TaxID=4058 RepID=A0ACC0AYW0_CATRO|nr:hypothetical protein M9H77_15908 [Catharanthus roseus]